ncbi:MAG: 3-deoxy-manno-octulosonate cytidylyltransferase [Gammaproteobacteria bacterium]|nr:3-deoxy-manno-octulosonate cytidylyltransferase [Gammaproteobacteria bacterium]
MSFSVVIPARFGATRLPGKPLLDICGKPMIQHTFERAMASSAAAVYIATDDERIRAVAEGFGAKVCMTATSHRSGTDRIQEVTAQLQLPPTHIVVNVQADEPLLPPQAINQVASNLALHPTVGIATLCEIITSKDEIDDPNSVKVVLSRQGRALYFSRSTIPWHASASAKNCYRHIGIYAYRVAVLNEFVQWPVTELELVEKLEQLRALYNDVPIHVEVSALQIPPGVDTERDLESVRAHLRGQQRNE